MNNYKQHTTRLQQLNSILTDSMLERFLYCIRHDVCCCGTRMRDAFGLEMDVLTKAQLMEDFISHVVQWVRDVGELDVPITMAAGVALEALLNNAELYLIRNWLRDLYLSSSDVITFHHYDNVNRMDAVLIGAAVFAWCRGCVVERNDRENGKDFWRGGLGRFLCRGLGVAAHGLMGGRR